MVSRWSCGNIYIFNTDLLAVNAFNLSSQPLLYRFYLIDMCLVNTIPYDRSVFDFESHKGLKTGWLLWWTKSSQRWYDSKSNIIDGVSCNDIFMWSLVEFVIYNDTQCCKHLTFGCIFCSAFCWETAPLYLVNCYMPCIYVLL